MYFMWFKKNCSCILNNMQLCDQVHYISSEINAGDVDQGVRGGTRLGASVRLRQLLPETLRVDICSSHGSKWTISPPCLKRSRRRLWSLWLNISSSAMFLLLQRHICSTHTHTHTHSDNQQTWRHQCNPQIELGYSTVCGCECDPQRRKPRYTSDNLYIKLSICQALKGENK